MITKRRRAATVLFTALSVLGGARIAHGQFSSSGQVGPTAPPDIEGFEAVEAGMDEALWDLRSLRLDPWIGIVEAGLVDNFSFETSDEGTTYSESPIDFRVIGGAGLRAYLPAGKHVILSANVLEEYTAWADDTDLNRAYFSWETGLFISGNRVDLGLETSRREEQSFATSETQELSDNTTETIEGAIQVRMFRSLYLDLSAAERDYFFESIGEDGGQTPGPEVLDRAEQNSRAGLLFKLGRSIELTVGYETTDSDFERDDRSTESTAPFLAFDYQGPKFGLFLDAARHDVTPTESSLVQPFEGTFGTAWLDLNSGGRIGVGLYVRRFAEYSVTTEFSHLVETTYGVDLGIPIATEIELRLFAETGTDEYATAVGATASREDDVIAYGGSLRIPLARSFGITIDGSQELYDSSLPGADRDASRIGIGFDFGLGSSGRGSWPSWP